MSGQFGVFNPLSKWKKGDMPYDLAINIVLNGWGSVGEDLVSISALLATDTEIDFAVDQLSKDLEFVRKEAKRVLKAQKEKIRRSIAG